MPKDDDNGMCQVAGAPKALPNQGRPDAPSLKFGEHRHGGQGERRARVAGGLHHDASQEEVPDHPWTVEGHEAELRDEGRRSAKGFDQARLVHATKRPLIDLEHGPMIVETFRPDRQQGVVFAEGPAQGGLLVPTSFGLPSQVVHLGLHLKQRGLAGWLSD